ncbi:unnamed protein product [Litomosoides sigmodontis]|uniref:Cathepsin propeptide inhibitor domain-containing protein n=1 Tax=Litomosoides sigmodontis TaxID=42156 RepID=A0A3P6T8B1_LITSI|nr:unnamed protein product [Litomosoides sigmodontis]
MGHYHQTVLLLIAINFIFNSESSVHNEFKALSHSKLRQLYSKHYDGYTKFVTEYKQGIEDDRPEPHRLLAYAKNMEEIKKHNQLYKQGKSSFMLGLTSMSDMTDEDLEEEFPVVEFDDTESHFPPNLTADLPAEVNWVTRNYVTKVRNLRSDRTCSSTRGAASSVANVLEALVKSRTKKLRSLSMQELLDCGDTSRCNAPGNLRQYADYITKQKGIVRPTSYSTTNRRQSCPPRGRRYGNANAILSIQDSKLLLFKALLSKGPVATRILLTPKFMNYKKGVFFDKSSSPRHFSHTVLAVGYKDNYILLKNSWGTDWGEKGYMRITTDAKQNCNIFLHSIAVL